MQACHITFHSIRNDDGVRIVHTFGHAKNFHANMSARVYVVIVAALALVCSSCAALSGPFVLWGTDRLQHARVGALQQLSDEQLRSIYAEAETIVVFVRNASLGPMRSELYPSCAKLLLEHHWAYLPQRTLTLDPLDFNGNAEVRDIIYYSMALNLYRLTV